MIKESLLKVVVEKYDELLMLIDQGAQFDKAHFQSLKESAVHQLESVHQINQDC